MTELQSYVEHLFSKYQMNHNIDELKAEILSNLEAKKMDLVASGLDEKTAVQKAKNSIVSIDGLIDGNKNIFINKLRLESLQQALLYLVIGWIVTIPVTLFANYIAVNLLLLFLAVIAGVLYLVMLKSPNHSMKTQYLNIYHYSKLKKTIWIMWGIFIAVCMLTITAVQFGSNVWYLKPIHIGGPYHFALLVLKYFTPFITVIIPLITGRIPKLIVKYEAGEHK